MDKEQIKLMREGSKADFRQAQAEYEAARKAAVDAGDQDTVNKLDALMASSNNYSSANPMNNRSQRQYLTQLYKDATLMAQGRDREISPGALGTTANMFNGYSRQENKDNANNVAWNFLVKNQMHNQAASQVQPSKLGDWWTFRWNDGMQWNEGDTTLADRISSYKSALSSNLTSLLDRMNSGYRIKGLDGLNTNEIQDLLSKLNSINPNDENALRQLSFVARRFDKDGSHWKSYFDNFLPKETQADINLKKLRQEGYVDADTSAWSDWAKNYSKQKGYKFLSDRDGNLYAFNKNYELAGKDSQISLGKDSYGHGLFIDDEGRAGFTLGDLKQGDQWYDAYNTLQNELRQKYDPQYSTYQFKIGSDYTDSDLMQNVVNEVSRINPTASTASMADVSNLFEGDFPVIAYTTNGQAIKKGRFNELDLSNPNIKFAYKDANGQIHNDVSLDVLQSEIGNYNIEGFGEGDYQGGRWASDADVMRNFADVEGLSPDEKLSKFNWKEFLATTAAGAGVGSAINLGIGTAVGAGIGAGTYLLGRVFTADSIRDNPKNFVNLIIKAYSDGNAKLDIPGTPVDMTGDQFLMSLGDGNQKAILETVGKLVYDGTVKLSPEERKRFNKVIRDAYVSRYVQSSKEGGELTPNYMMELIQYAKQGDSLFSNGEPKSQVTDWHNQYNKKLEKMDNLAAIAAAEGKTPAQYEASKNTKLTTADTMRIGAIAADVVSIASSFTGAGAAVAEATGIASFGINTLADIADPSVSAGEALKNTAIGAGLAAISFIPGSKISSTLAKVVKIAPTVMMAAGAMDIAMDESTQETFKKITAGKDKLNTQDWKNLAHVMMLVSAGTRGGRRAYEKYSVKNNKNFYKARNGETMDIFYKGENIGKLDKTQTKAFEEALKAAEKGDTKNAAKWLQKTGIKIDGQELTPETAKGFVESPEGWFAEHLAKFTGKKSSIKDLEIKSPDKEWDYGKLAEAYEEAGKTPNVGWGWMRNRPTWKQQGIIDATGIRSEGFNSSEGVARALRDKIAETSESVESPKTPISSDLGAASNKAAQAANDKVLISPESITGLAQKGAEGRWARIRQTGAPSESPTVNPSNSNPIADNAGAKADSIKQMLELPEPSKYGSMRDQTGGAPQRLALPMSAESQLADGSIRTGQGTPTLDSEVVNILMREAMRSGNTKLIGQERISATEIAAHMLVKPHLYTKSEGTQILRKLRESGDWIDRLFAKSLQKTLLEGNFLRQGGRL